VPTYGCVIKNDSGTVVTDGTIELDASSSQASFAIVSMAAPATVASSAVVPFDTVKSDTDGYWSAAGHEFVVPVGKGGVFYVEAGILGDNSALATGAYLELGNGGPDPNMQAPLVNVNGGVWKGAGGSTIRLADGDTVECQLAVFTAATMDVDAGSHFSISRWGDV
jgi:hypothetical protein